MVGVIPVPAGQPCGRDHSAAGRKGHPRTCGAARLSLPSTARRSGSSPYLRGSPGGGPLPLWHRGVIPVPAGQPPPPFPCWRRVWGHPRTCGAAEVMAGRVWFSSGSSPYLRGSQVRRRMPPATRWVIPVPAGQPDPRPEQVGQLRGHPRTCGAATLSRAFSAAGPGSSPYLRGSPADAPEGPAGRGVIPVPAGQPGQQHDEHAPGAGHPRTCGAAGFQTARLRDVEGSSPYLRGSPDWMLASSWSTGVIPVPAGQPSCTRSIASWGRGHPRTCGAAAYAPAVVQHDPGSSPYLRGSRPLQPAPPTFDRVIPVPAGQPAAQ